MTTTGPVGACYDRCAAGPRPRTISVHTDGLEGPPPRAGVRATAATRMPGTGASRCTRIMRAVRPRRSGQPGWGGRHPVGVGSSSVKHGAFSRLDRSRSSLAAEARSLPIRRLPHSRRVRAGTGLE